MFAFEKLYYVSELHLAYLYACNIGICEIGRSCVCFKRFNICVHSMPCSGLCERALTNLQVNIANRIAIASIIKMQVRYESKFHDLMNNVRSDLYINVNNVMNTNKLFKMYNMLLIGKQVIKRSSTLKRITNEFNEFAAIFNKIADRLNVSMHSFNELCTSDELIDE
jgi:hypothetical protein